MFPCISQDFSNSYTDTILIYKLKDTEDYTTHKHLLIRYTYCVLTTIYHKQID